MKTLCDTCRHDLPNRDCKYACSGVTGWDKENEIVTTCDDYEVKPLSESPIVWHIPSEQAYDRLEELEEYLSNFPDGIMADAARHEVEHLKALLLLDY